MAKPANPGSRRSSSRDQTVDLREVVRAAKAAQGQERPGVETAELAMRAELSALRRSAAKQLEPLVSKAVDLRAAKAVLAGYEKERAKLLKSRMPTIGKALAGSAKQQSQAAAARRRALEVLAGGGLGLAATTITLKPVLIWATNPSTMLVDSHADAVGYSWAKISLSRNQLRPETVNRGWDQSSLVFHHLWTNSSDEVAIVNARCSARFNGFASATANTTFFGGTETYVSCAAYLTPIEHWKQPPVPLGPNSVDGFWYVFRAHATGGSILSLETGDLDVATLSNATRDLRWDLFAVPPGATAMFQFAMYFNYAVSDGHMAIDFASQPQFSIASLMQLELPITRL